MKKILFHPGSHGRSASIGLFILRLAAGGMMLAGHGWSKLAGFSDKASRFPDPLGIGNELSLAATVGTEVFCAAALIAGIATRWVCAPLLFTMGVAVLVVHGSDPFAKKELALLYGVTFLTILFTGPGRLSIDASIHKG